MSITFSGGSMDEEDQATYLNLNQRNARDLLEWLGLPTPPEGDDDMFGEIEAQELAARCRRRLWPVARNTDDELLGEVHEAANGHCKSIECPRPAGYLREKTQALLTLCERSIEGKIYWN
jgi:hypothetical protein